MSWTIKRLRRQVNGYPGIAVINDKTGEVMETDVVEFDCRCRIDACVDGGGPGFKLFGPLSGKGMKVENCSGVTFSEDEDG